jgi:hypothetical protein
MENSTQGTQILTDNWLLQDSAQLLERTSDPNSNMLWMELNSKGNIQFNPITKGAIQLLCLTSLIEQIIIYDSMRVMNFWNLTWEPKSSQLKVLVKEGMIHYFDNQNDNFNKQLIEYQKIINGIPALTAASQYGESSFKKGNRSYLGQIINGTLPYITQADINNYIYSPHPVRARFLNQVFYKPNDSINPQQKLNEIINTSRVKLCKRIGIDSSVTTLNSKISSFALLCLRESSQQSLPIQTALEIRNLEEFRRLRNHLFDMQTSIANNNEESIKKYLSQIELLETAINEVERKLKLRELGDRDGFSELTIWRSLKVKIPDALRRPLIMPRYTTALNRLVLTAGTDIRRVLKKSLGIANPQIIEDLISFGN